MRRGRGGRRGGGVFDLLDDEDDEEEQNQDVAREAAQVRMVRNHMYLGE